MSIPITITITSIINTPGPFELYSCANGLCSGTPFETGILLSSLQNGYGVLAPDGTDSVRITSTGEGCNRSKDYSISGLPATSTPTPTQTVTTTPTLTPTVTPTSTLATVWYSLYNCWDDSHYYSEPKNLGFIPEPLPLSPPWPRVYGFKPGDPDSSHGIWTVQGKTYTEPLTDLVSIQYLGEEGCPTIDPSPVPLYSTVYFAVISGFTESQTQTALCGKTLFTEPYNYAPNGGVHTKYITYEANGLTPGTLYTIYNTSNRTPGDEFNGGNRYYGVSIDDPNSKVTHTVYINSVGELSGWNDCP